MKLFKFSPPIFSEFMHLYIHSEKVGVENLNSFIELFRKKMKYLRFHKFTMGLVKKEETCRFLLTISFSSAPHKEGMYDTLSY